MAAEGNVSRDETVLRPSGANSFIQEICTVCWGLGGARLSQDIKYSTAGSDMDTHT